MLLRILIQIGFFSAAVFSPFLLLFWFWSDKKITTGHWFAISCILLVSFLLMQVYVLALLMLLVVLAFLAAWLMNRVTLFDVTYSRNLERDHFFPDDTGEVTWTLRNDKPLPISWLRWTEFLPGMRFGSRESDGIEWFGIGSKFVPSGQRTALDQISALRSYESMSRTERFRAIHRGHYIFGDGDVEASDGLGMFRSQTTFRTEHAITVYPRLLKSSPVELDVRALLGEWRRRNSLIEDPVWYRGNRDYRSEDSPRLIDWRSTARTGNLQVKMFEPTAHPKLMLLVNLHVFESIASGWITENMEDVISMAASIASWARELGFEIGIHSNGALPGAFVPYRVLPSARDSQLFEILDYLAKISLVVSRPIEDTLEDLSDLPYGTSVMICTSVITPGLVSRLDHKWKRRNLAVVLVNGATSVNIPGVTVLQPHFEEAA